MSRRNMKKGLKYNLISNQPSTIIAPVIASPPAHFSFRAITLETSLHPTFDPRLIETSGWKSSRRWTGGNGGDSDCGGGRGYNRSGFDLKCYESGENDHFVHKCMTHGGSRKHKNHTSPRYCRSPCYEGVLSPCDRSP
ncbi:serine/arginine-rich splicing factor RSZ22-like isoform X2 [Olea europaea var. sylvestris]|uniref:serine/arginine-rich splicing factor RSZ22-like isoform X2 n=1 Tax=Olea europaea var. sylvestris TaxID=158386 RepID=UPI000C1CE9B7|nr:serine/arginine-rich splicing factor RSZ22-like isoform X2 [Olea europaea var. sylvestris]